MKIAKQVHRAARAKQTFLFGSRARGDHLPNSDIDLLVVTPKAKNAEWLDILRMKARKIQRTTLPEASGIDVIHMREEAFRSEIHLRNSMANTIVRQGLPIISGARIEYQYSFEDEETDWNDVDRKLSDADDAVQWIEGIEQAGIIRSGNDKQFGIIAQNALEFAYKATLAAYGCDYPTSGRDGHNLTIMATRIRENKIVVNGQDVPGEEHSYLTEFGGADVRAHEQPPLDRRRIAEEIPQAVRELEDLVDQARRQAS